MFKLWNMHPALNSAGEKRFNHFNFLRFIFASLVILSHTFELIDGNRSREPLTGIFGTISFAEFAVDGFFLLSGYLIVKSWDSSPEIFAFLSKRILRIYPGFIVASLVCAFIVGPLGAEPADYFSHLEVKKLAYGIIRLWGPIVPPVFVGQPHAAVNGAMWTIPYEFACYLSVLLIGFCGLVKYRRGWLAITACFFIAVLCQKLGLQPLLQEYSINLESSFFRLGMFFFTGGAYYLLRDEIKFCPRMAWGSGLILSMAMFYPVTSEPILAILGGYLLFHFSFSPISLLESFQKLPDVSYGLYLYGWPIQKLLIWYLPELPAWWVFVFSFAGSVLAGLISWYLVEKPFLKLKPKGV